MTLIAHAEDAEDIADALSKFKTPVPEHAPDITASISELYAIGSCLRDTDTALGPWTFTSQSWSAQRDLDLVCSGLNATIKNIFRILGDIGNGSSFLNDRMYRETWKDITCFFNQNGQVPLKVRLGIYKDFICQVARVLKRLVLSP